MKHRIIPAVVGALVVAFTWQAQSRKVRSVLGTWHLEITVPPAAMATNELTFSGSETGGQFVDKNKHEGDWKLEGDKISWTYLSVPNLKNTFSGTLNDDFTKMEGTNEGQWQGQAFKGNWTGVATPSAANGSGAMRGSFGFGETPDSGAGAGPVKLTQ